MQVWPKSVRWSAWGCGGLLVVLVYLLPLAIIALASIAGQWNGMLPSHLTLQHYADAVLGESGVQLKASLITGFIASRPLPVAVGRRWRCGGQDLRSAGSSAFSSSCPAPFLPSPSALDCWWRSAARRSC
jgi:hypothetical protein